MANSLNIAFDIDQPAAPLERSINSGSTWTALPVPTTGTHKTALLTGIPAAAYAVGVIQIRPVGYPAQMVSNTVAVTVAASAVNMSLPVYTLTQGDSITAGSVVNNPWPVYFNQNAGATYATFVNRAVGGKRTDMAESETAATVSQFNAAGSSGAQRLYVYFVGVNDLRPADVGGNIRTSSQIVASIYANISAVKAAGASVLVVSVLPDRQVSQSNPTEDARRLQVRADVNNLLAAAEGTNGMDKFLDLRGKTDVGNSDAPITQAGVTYTADLIHPNDNGELALAAYLLDAANTLLGRASASGTVPASWVTNAGAASTGAQVRTAGDSSSLFSALGVADKKILPPLSGDNWGSVLITLDRASDLLVGVSPLTTGYDAASYTGPGYKTLLSLAGAVKVFEQGANVYEDTPAGYAITEQFRADIHTAYIDWFRSRNNFATSYHRSARTDNGVELALVANLNAGGGGSSACSVSFVNCRLVNRAPASTAPPAFTAMNPTAGPLGASVVITGLHFGSTQGTGVVKFNGELAQITSWSDTSITATVPATATTGQVVMATAYGLASCGTFTVQ